MSNYTNCDGCPCQNNSEEITCNLGYNTDYEHFSDGNWYHYSDNCGLFLIETDGGPISVDKIVFEIAPEIPTGKEDKLSLAFKKVYGKMIVELLG